MDWLDLLAVQGTLKSLLQHHSSKASILQRSAFFIVQLSHPYMTTEKTIALTRWTLVDKVMSLLLNMLSRLIITFLLRAQLGSCKLGLHAFDIKCRLRLLTANSNGFALWTIQSASSLGPQLKLSEYLHMIYLLVWISHSRELGYVSEHSEIQWKVSCSKQYRRKLKDRTSNDSVLGVSEVTSVTFCWSRKPPRFKMRRVRFHLLI